MDAGIPDEALGELLGVESVLKKKEAPVGGWTVRSAFTAMKKLYVKRNRVAANWRQETRRMEKQAEDTKNRLAETERELAGRKRQVDVMTDESVRGHGKL